MNGIRRGLTVLVLTAATSAGTFVTTAPAQATFAEAAAVPTSITSGTVAAPTQVEARALCTTTTGPDGNASTTVEVKVEWWQSASPGVSGYLITAYPAGGPPYELARTTPTDEVFLSTDQDLVDSGSQFTVTTLTAYGWTAESVRTEPLTC